VSYEAVLTASALSDDGEDSVSEVLEYSGVDSGRWAHPMLVTRRHLGW